eukprot:snap_masked-scaffold_27-processed-gene-2.35-mRNA-1 protein AED:1.00 eAED:1.00 QI:0/-1/0/0/-1/1/1/0/82
MKVSLFEHRNVEREKAITKEIRDMANQDHNSWIDSVVSEIQQEFLKNNTSKTYILIKLLKPVYKKAARTRQNEAGAIINVYQ